MPKPKPRPRPGKRDLECKLSRFSTHPIVRQTTHLGGTDESAWLSAREPASGVASNAKPKVPVNPNPPPPIRAKTPPNSQPVPATQPQPMPNAPRTKREPEPESWDEAIEED